MSNVTESSNQLEAKIRDRGNRVRSVRKDFDLSREKFAKLLEMPKGTLQNWEDGRHNGLGGSGAYKFCEKLKNLKGRPYHCTIAWLMEGKGEPPFFINQPLPTKAESFACDETTTIAKELQLFHQLNANAVDTIITDDSMEPLYHTGDHVAGKRLFGKDITKAISKTCIVHTQEGSGVTVGIIKKGKKPEKFTIENAKSKKVIMQDVSLFSAAPIIWIRRKSYN